LTVHASDGGAIGQLDRQSRHVRFAPRTLNPKVIDEFGKVTEDDTAAIAKAVNSLDGIPVGTSSGAII
jgi:cysteine synthase